MHVCRVAVSVWLAARRWQQDSQQKSSLLEVLDNDKVVTRKMISLQVVRKEPHSVCVPTNPVHGGVQMFLHPTDKIDFKYIFFYNKWNV